MRINEIIEKLGDSGSNLVDALMQTKILLHDIGQKELAAWVDHELKGYGESDPLPDYRILQSQVIGDILGGGLYRREVLLPIQHLPSNAIAVLTRTELRQSLVSLAELAKGKSISAMVAAEWLPHLTRGIDAGFSVERARLSISSHEITAILTQVRTRLLEFLLELRTKAGGPDATAATIKDNVSAATAKELFQNAVFGNNAQVIVQVGATNTNVSTNIEDSFNVLAQALQNAGISESDIAALKSALKADEAEGRKPGMTARVGAWLSDMMKKAAGGAASKLGEISVEQAAALAPLLIEHLGRMAGS